MAYNKPPSEFFEPEFLTELLPLMEKHEVFVSTKGNPVKTKWELVAEDLFNALDDKKFRMVTGGALRVKFSVFRKMVIDSNYAAFLQLDPSVTLGCNEISNPFHLRLVNMLRKADYYNKTGMQSPKRAAIDEGYESEATNDNVIQLPDPTNDYATNKRLRFHTPGEVDSDEDDASFFMDSATPTNKESILSLPLKGERFLTKRNTKKNAGDATSNNKGSGGSRSKKARSLQGGIGYIGNLIELVMSSAASQNPQSVMALIEKQQEWELTVLAAENTGKELDLKVQEAKNREKALELEIERVALEKVKQHLLLLPRSDERN
ncbi:hypothetical protein EON65_27300 [archaeon]|nr:MAG: hypothetical protein EON65_27300 [archaeon]